MTSLRWAAAALTLAGLLGLTAADGLGQPPDQKDFFQKKGFGPFGGGERKILKDHDKDGDGRLNKDERAAAREALKKDGGKGGFGPKMGFGKGGEPGRPGPNVAPADVKNYPNAALYETNVLRTLFVEFENKDWETELQDFRGTDVEVPCTMTVDGKKYRNVGVHFRGASSYGGVSAGSKRSMNLSLDFADKKQRLHGAKTLNLLNAHEDASFMSTVLSSHIARPYIPAPKANFVKVVINGESWGLYVNVQQFDKEFVVENFKTDKGARWKVSGSPGGGGGLEYLGENIADYKRRYEIKTKDDDKSWKALINLCKVLNQTPPDKLEEALRPIADVDGLLWFLALDIALINNDGYWIRASDYSLYLDGKNKFHVVPHDMNESFRPGGGPGFGGGGMRVFGRPGEVLPVPLQDMLGLTAEQKKKLTDLQKEADDQLGKIFTEEQNKQWKQIREGGPGGFGPPPGGPVGPGGFGPPPVGPGGPGGGPGGSGVEIDPLYGLNDARKPLRSKVLASPNLRAKYLANVKTIAEDGLDWKRLGPVVAMYRSVIEKDVQADTRKLESFEAFQRMTADVADPNARGRGIPLRAFADQRRKYLLAYQPPAPGK